MKCTRRGFLASAALTGGMAMLTGQATAADAEVIEARTSLALSRLYASVPGAQGLVADAKGVLVMPSVVKGGFIVGGAYGEGALKLPQSAGTLQTAEYYSVAAASVGFQAGVQESSHVLVFLTDSALSSFRRRDGWELGVDAEATVLDKGANIGLSTAEFRRPVVAIVFGEDGLLLGASLEGAKYSRILR